MIDVRSLRSEEDCEQFVQETPDDLLGQALHNALSVEQRSVPIGEDQTFAFKMIFKKIVISRADDTLLQKIAVKESHWLFWELIYATSPNVREAVLKFISVTFPAVIRDLSKNFRHLEDFVGMILRILYATLKDNKEVFLKYSNFILEALSDKEIGWDPDEVIAAALKYGSNKEQILRLMTGSDWDKLRKKVVGTSSVRVWDPLCRVTDTSRVTEADLTFLRNKARFYEIENWEKLNVRQLCAGLAKVNISNHDCSLEDSDPWSMEAMSDIPRHRWYKIDKHCFDIESLHEAIKRGETTNPFTRAELPVQDILARYNAINTYYNPKKKVASYLENVPMLTREHLRSQTLGTIWSHFRYPIPVSSFLTANEKELDDCIEAMQSYSAIPLSQNEVERYLTAGNRDAKFAVLLQILQRLVSLPRTENTATIEQAIEMALQDSITVDGPIPRRRRSSVTQDERNVRPRLSGGWRRHRPGSSKSRTRSRRKSRSRKRNRSRNRSRNRNRSRSRRCNQSPIRKLYY